MGDKNWKTLPLSEIIEISHGFGFKGQHFSKDPKKDVLLTPGNFAIGGGFKGDKLKYYEGPVGEDFVLSHGDLVVTMTDLSKASDTLGYPALIPYSEKHRFLHNQRLGKIIVRKPDLIDKLFLYFWLRTRKYRYQVVAGATGTTVKHTSPSRILKIKIDLPPLPMQRHIAHILGTLDDKIEVNRSMNATLEAMARAIFKSWFVDFDPVRAKMDGRDTSLPAEVAALFPDSFEDSALGKIPRSWEVGTLDSVGEVTIGGDWGKEDKIEDGIAVSCLRGVDLEHLRKYGSAEPPVRWIKPASLKKREILDCDVIIAASGAGPLGRPLWMSDYVTSLFDLPVTYSNFTKRIRMNSKIYAIYVDRLLFEMRRSGEIWEYSTGTALPNLDLNGLMAGRKILIPPEELLSAFQYLVVPIYEKLYSNENRILVELRDTLLPKLMRGEVELKSLQEFEGG